MKCLVLNLILNSVVGGQNSCILPKDLEDLLFTQRHYLYERYPLSSYLSYHNTRKEVRNIVDLKLCNIKDTCSTRINETEYEFDNWYSFCEMFFFFEHKSNHVFKISHLGMWFFTSENITIRSNEVLNNSGNFFITTG